MTFSINQQIEELRREIKLRERVYPHQVAKRNFTQSEADYFMGRMQAALRTLEWVKRHERAIRDAIATSEVKGDQDPGIPAPAGTGRVDPRADAQEAQDVPPQPVGRLAASE